jgi:PAS domain S-box-containing protein
MTNSLPIAALIIASLCGMGLWAWQARTARKLKDLHERNANLERQLAAAIEPEVLAEAQALAERERMQMRMLLETVTDGIHVLDEQGDLVYCSSSFARMLGFTPEEMTRRHFSAWSPDEDGTDLAATIPALIEQPSVVETQLRRRNGSLIDVEIGARSVDLNGVRYVYRSARDLSERKRVDFENRQQVQELERINKELDDFVYVASHDLRSPLRAIKTLAQWIIDDDASVDAKTKERLQLIQGRAQRMARLLDDVMVYARAGNTTGTVAVMSAAALTGEIAVTLQVPDGYRILTDPSLESVMVRRAPLEQVIHNLIGNAIKHHDRDQGSVRIWAVDIENSHRFFVADDGPGIPEQYRDAVFEMFTTLKPRDEVEGSGMGLALVRKVVTKLGGECGIEASSGRGTCFWFDWPKLI